MKICLPGREAEPRGQITRLQEGRERSYDNELLSALIALSKAKSATVWKGSGHLHRTYNKWLKQNWI